MDEKEDKLARKLATRAVPTAQPDTTVKEILTNIETFSDKFETVDYIYIIENEILVGVVSLHELFSRPGEVKVNSFMTTEIAFVHANSSQENVAHLALAENIKAVPVLTDDHFFLGVVQSDVILQVLREEHTEDILKYAGINFDSSERLAEYSILQHYTSRIPWLILGLGGGILAAWVVEHFSFIITKEIALAAFIPAIVYIADAVGSQSQMVYVRSLVTSKRNKLGFSLGRELVIGTAVGFTLSLSIGVFSYLWLQSLTVSSILSLAVLATVYFSVIVAILLPWVFHKIGQDPAIASGPLATVIRDVSSLCIYFLIALSLL